MGDHRASIKIEMEFHGVKDICDMWINYIPGEFDGVDDRITKFFRKVYEKGMDKYHQQMDEYWEEQNKEHVERQERELLVQLKRKYED